MFISKKYKIIGGIAVVLLILNLTDFIKIGSINISWLSGDAFILLVIISNLISIVRIKLGFYTIGEVQSYTLVDEENKKTWTSGKRIRAEIKFATIDKQENTAQVDSFWRETPRIGQKVKLVINKRNYNKSEILEDSQLPITTTIILVCVFAYLMYLTFK